MYLGRSFTPAWKLLVLNLTHTFFFIFAVDNVSQKQSNELIVLAEGDDRIEQENELFALEAIFENEDLEICKHNNPNGHPPGIKEYLQMYLIDKCF